MVNIMFLKYLCTINFVSLCLKNLALLVVLWLANKLWQHSQTWNTHNKGSRWLWYTMHRTGIYWHHALSRLNTARQKAYYHQWHKNLTILFCCVVRRRVSANQSFYTVIVCLFIRLLMNIKCKKSQEYKNNTKPYMYQIQIHEQVISHLLLREQLPWDEKPFYV